jgi:hypothetical protein
MVLFMGFYVWGVGGADLLGSWLRHVLPCWVRTIYELRWNRMNSWPPYLRGWEWMFFSLLAQSPLVFLGFGFELPWLGCPSPCGRGSYLYYEGVTPLVKDKRPRPLPSGDPWVQVRAPCFWMGWLYFRSSWSGMPMWCWLHGNGELPFRTRLYMARS